MFAFNLSKISFYTIPLNIFVDETIILKVSYYFENYILIQKFKKYFYTYKFFVILFLASDVIKYLIVTSPDHNILIKHYRKCSLDIYD